MTDRVVIIGGGIIGIAAAHFLRAGGFDVTVVDKGRIGGACSHGNCGLVCPSHVLPLAEPGAIRQTLKAMLTPGSAFRIKPRLDAALIRWLWRFSRRCNRSDMMKSAAAIQPLLVQSLRLYQDLVDPSSEDGIECLWKKQGLLFAYRDAAALHAYRPTNELLTAHFDEPARLIEGRALAEFEPSLRADLAGGWYFEHDAHLRPDLLIRSWSDRLRRQGVTMIENASLERFIRQDARVTGAVLATADGPRSIPADSVLVATGAWTPMLSSLLNFEIPIQPGKGYSVTVDAPTDAPSMPMIFPQVRVAVTPMGDRLRLGSIMEFAGYDDSIRPERLKLLTDGAGAYLKDDPTAGIGKIAEGDRWQGWRPMTYDSTPVIGRCPGFENVFLSAGHNMLGLSMAPASGKLASQLIAGVPTDLDPTPYRAERFGR